jgi:hypothetical protein
VLFAAYAPELYLAEYVWAQPTMSSPTEHGMISSNFVID